MLADQVDDHPAAVTLLDVGQGERGELRAAQAAAEQNGKDGAIADALAHRWIRRVEQALGVDLAEPVAGAGAGRGHAPDPGHAGGELRIEQAVVGGLTGQGADGRELLVDGPVLEHDVWFDNAPAVRHCGLAFEAVRTGP